MKRRIKVIAIVVLALGFGSMLMPSLHWTGGAPVQIEVEVRDAGTKTPLPAVQLVLEIDGTRPGGLTPLTTTGADGRGRLVGMFGAGGTRTPVWSSGGIGTDAGVVRCDLAGYQRAEVKLPRTKTWQLFGIGPSPRLTVRAALHRNPT